MMVIYNLWQARNDARESQLIADPTSVVLKTAAALEEWKEVHKISSHAAGAKPSEQWLRPELGWVKVNADVAYHSADGVGGGGVVLRDHHDNFVSGASHFFAHLIDAEHAELLACRQGLLLARDHQVQRVVLETDCTGVAAKLRRDGQDRSIHGPLVAQNQVPLSRVRRHFGAGGVKNGEWFSAHFSEGRLR
jgi:ribonuclease HI